MERPTIAVLEDDPDTLDLYASLLRTAGYDVLTASRASDLVDHLRHVKTPAAIIMDLGLPDAQGVWLCRRIRAQRDLARVPIIAVTGWSSGPVVEGVGDAPFNEVFLKPVPPAVILDALARWVPWSANPLSTQTQRHGERVD